MRRVSYDAAMGNPDENRGGLVGCLLSWIGLFAVAVVLLAFTLASVQLVAMLVGREDLTDLFAPGVAVAIAVGCLLVFDVGLRLAGRKRISHALPVAGAEAMHRDPERFGRKRALAPGLGELAFLPIMLLIAVCVVGAGDSGGTIVVTIVAGLVVTVAPIIAFLFRVPWAIVAGAAAWLPWAVLTAYGRTGPATAAGLALGAVVWVLMYRSIMHTEAARQLEADREDAADHQHALDKDGHLEDGGAS